MVTRERKEECEGNDTIQGRCLPVTGSPSLIKRGIQESPHGFQEDRAHSGKRATTVLTRKLWL